MIGRLRVIAVLVALTAGPALSQAQTGPGEDLRIYAVGVVNAAPFKRPLSGYGIYLGQDAIITPAHVVGHWSLFDNPTILVGGQRVVAKIIKKGSFATIDLALLVVPDDSLPVSLRLRQNPLCHSVPDSNSNVEIVYPDRTLRSKMVSPQAIGPRYREKFKTLVSEPQGSGSGVFDPDKKCLLGIMSAAIIRRSRRADALPLRGFPWERSVGYFVPASAIASFLPDHLRF